MASVEPIPARNDNLGAASTPLTGQLYAFTASGGLVLEQGFADIVTLADVSGGVLQRDMTNVPQILVSADLFNVALGKLDAVGGSVQTLSSYFDEDSQQYTVAGNKISLTAAQISNDMAPDASNVVHLGKLTTLYTSFETYVQTYFGYFGGFASLFDSASNYDIAQGFNHTELHTLMTTSSADSGNGAEIVAMSGTIEILDVTEAIRFAVDGNIFNNRDVFPVETQDTDPNTASDASQNFGPADGFQPGDLIYLANGLEIKLDVDVASEAYLPINNLGPANASVVQQTNASVDNTLVTTNATLSNISRIVKSPLLIRLK
jgi:hypothetical protein